MITKEEFDQIVENWAIKVAPKDWRYGQKIFNATEEMFGSAIAREMDVNIHSSCFYVTNTDESRDEKINKFREESYKNYCSYCNDFSKFDKRIMDETISYSKYSKEKDFNKLLYMVVGRLFGSYIPESVGTIMLAGDTNSGRREFIKKCFDVMQSPQKIIDYKYE